MANDRSYTAAELAKAVEMKQAGKGWTEVLKRTGVPRGAAMLAFYEANLKPADRKPIAGKTDEEAAKIVAELRVAGNSWGEIMVRTGAGETRVRNLFGKATGIASEGTRNGRGGRFLEREPRFYAGNRKGFGVEAPKPRELDPVQVAKTADKAKTKLPELVKKAGAKKVAQKAAKRPAPKKAAAENTTTEN